MISRSQLLSMGVTSARADVYLDPINETLKEFGITSKHNQAAFLATILHESGYLAYVEENLNYSAEGLMRTWPTRFPSVALANQYARQPQKIANFVYANRGGNGDVASGDGWRFRGCGSIQLTFKDNHAACAKYFGKTLDEIGPWLRTPMGATRSAGWFWSKNNLSRLADANNFQGVCGMVNCGSPQAPASKIIGLKERNSLYQKISLILA